LALQVEIFDIGLPLIGIVVFWDTANKIFKIINCEIVDILCKASCDPMLSPTAGSF